MTAAPETTALPYELPHRFGKTYLLFDRIGQGGMAEIFLARGKTQIEATRLAVVKLVLPVLASDAKFAAMLVAEAKLAAQLSHANVVQTYDLGREDGRLYIAMEYVEGFDLNELLRRCARAKLPLPAEFALFVVTETLRALDYAHRRKDPEGKPLGIVHRDVSPSNVLISFEGEIKLCDFGIARAVSATHDLTPEAIEGKAAYMSPEQARGLPIDGRSDIFSASIILWEMLAGRRLYKATAEMDPLSVARAANIPALPDRGLPDHARLAAIVAKGLAVEPEARYPTALAMVRELDAYAMSTRLLASPLRLGSFLTDHFGTEILEARRARERAASMIDSAPVTSFPPPIESEGEGADVAVPSRERSAVRARGSEPVAYASVPDSDPGAETDAAAALAAAAALDAASDEQTSVRMRPAEVLAAMLEGAPPDDSIPSFDEPTTRVETPAMFRSSRPAPAAVLPPMVARTSIPAPAPTAVSASVSAPAPAPAPAPSTATPVRSNRGPAREWIVRAALAGVGVATVAATVSWLLLAHH